MAATITWKINEMQRTTADGGVTEVRWECIGTDEDATAGEAHVYTCTYDASASDFIKYEDLKESDVVGWVKSFCNAQPLDRMKVDAIEKRVADDCATRVAEIEKAKTKSIGLPW